MIRSHYHVLFERHKKREEGGTWLLLPHLHRETYGSLLTPGEELDVMAVVLSVYRRLGTGRGLVVLVADGWWVLEEVTNGPGHEQGMETRPNGVGKDEWLWAVRSEAYLPVSL